MYLRETLSLCCENYVLDLILGKENVFRAN